MINLPSYKNILVAVELNWEEDQVLIAKAQDLAQRYDSSIHIVHAVEHVNTYGTAPAYPTVAGIEQELLKEHEEKLNKLAEENSIPPAGRFIQIGSPALVIEEIAKKINADLIVIGSHGRNWLSVFFGSTTDSILHRIKCNVLTIYLENKKIK